MDVEVGPSGLSLTPRTSHPLGDTRRPWPDAGVPNQPSDCIQMVDSKRPPPVWMKLKRPQQCPFNLAGPTETTRTLLSVV